MAACDDTSLLDPRSLDLRCVVKSDFDTTAEGLARRARTAPEIIRRHFGHRSVPDLRRIRNTIDASRPVFNSEKRNGVPREISLGLSSAMKDLKAGKHCKAEQDRRAVHAANFVEAGKRIPDAIMELAGYKRGSRKGPGKHPLYLARLLMHEFDTLLQEKQDERAERDGQLIREYERRLRMLRQAPEQGPDQSRRRRSPISEDNVVFVDSPRKRRRNSPSTSATPSGWGSSTFSYQAHENRSGYYHRRTFASRPYHRQQHSLPSPSPSHRSWTPRSCRSGSPASAP